MDRQYNKGKKKIKENHRTLIDDDDFEEDIFLFAPQPSVDAAVEDISLSFSQPSEDVAVEDISLSAPHPSQDAAVEDIFMFDLSLWKGTTSATTWKGNSSSTRKLFQQFRMDKEKKKEKKTYITLVDEDDFEPAFDLDFKAALRSGIEEDLPWKPR